MKNYILLLTLISFLKMNAQDTVNNSLATEPTSSCELRYYYFPNMEAYYDLKEQVYHFYVDHSWKTGEQLPQYYGGYSLFKNERVQITDYDGDHPEVLIKKHRKEFPYNPKGRIKRPLQNTTDENATALIE